MCAAGEAKGGNLSTAQHEAYHVYLRGASSGGRGSQISGEIGDHIMKHVPRGTVNCGSGLHENAKCGVPVV